MSRTSDDVRRARRLSSALLGGLLLAMPLAVHAQAAAAASRTDPATRPVEHTYLYLRGSDTVAFETVSQSISAISGSMNAKASGRIEWRHELLSPREYASLALRFFAPGADTPQQSATMRIRGDSAIAEISAGSQAARQALPTKTGAIALVNSSMVHAVILGTRALAAGQSSLDFFLTSGGQTVPATVLRRGDTTIVSIANSEARALMGSDGLPSQILVPSQNVRIVIGGPGAAAAAVSKPVDYSAPPGAPYTAEQVRIPTARGYELAATLTRPVVNRPVPVVITISGSGLQDRDSHIPREIDPSAQYAFFREIADTLGRRGVAVLRFDDRGAGQSGGANTLATATSADLADDVRAIVAWLRARKDIDASRIALAGHSEGGIIAPMVAAADSGVRAIALMAGSAYTGRRVMLSQNRESIEAAPALTRLQKDSVFKTVPAALDSLGKTMPWVAFFMAHDPLETIRRVKQPVLILQGETDHQVSPEQADTLAAALRASGNRAVTLRKFPATNHLFLVDPSGQFSGYATLKDYHVRKEVLGALADWAVMTLR